MKENSHDSQRIKIQSHLLIIKPNLVCSQPIFLNISPCALSCPLCNMYTFEQLENIGISGHLASTLNFSFVAEQYHLQEMQHHQNKLPVANITK